MTGRTLQRQGGPRTGKWLALLLLITVAAPPALADLPEVSALNPHLRSRCESCHVSEDDETLLNEDVNALCCKCHDPALPQWKHHPLLQVPKAMKFPESWPQSDQGLLTCLSCHVPGHEEDQEIPKLLRDGPYPKTDKFCRMCHPEATKGATDVHRQANVGQGEGCPVCHEKTPVPGKDTPETATYTVRVTIMCLMCHDYDPHPAGQDHCMARPGTRAVAIPSTFTILDEQITCASCHNPHIQENEGAKLRDSVIGIEICLQCHQL